MRPTPAETIAGVRQILRDVIEPELGSEYAKTRLSEVRAVLAQIDWNDSALLLHRETESMRALLAEVAQWAAEDPARGPHFGTAPAATAVPKGPLPYEELAAAHQSVAGELAATATSLDNWCIAHPDDESARALRRRLIRALETSD